MGMIIKRVIDGKEREIELTKEELLTAYCQQEHEWDLEYVRSSMSQSEGEDFEKLSEAEYEAALDNIAYEMRHQEDKYGFDKADALVEAKKWYCKTCLAKEEK